MISLLFLAFLVGPLVCLALSKNKEWHFHGDQNFDSVALGLSASVIREEDGSPCGYSAEVAFLFWDFAILVTDTHA